MYQAANIQRLVQRFSRTGTATVRKVSPKTVNLLNLSHSSTSKLQGLFGARVAARQPSQK